MFIIDGIFSEYLWYQKLNEHISTSFYFKMYTKGILLQTKLQNPIKFN